MSTIDSSITHITPADGNVFADLGFAPEEAAKLKIKAQLMIQLEAWIKLEGSANVLRFKSFKL
jgi:predicted XRE-type DNA-binding protein